MNNKGQAAIGSLIILAVAIIVGSVLLSGNGGISSGVGALSNQVTVVNQTITLAAANGFTDIEGCVNFAGTPLVSNATGQVVVNAGNYTFTTRVSPTLSLKVLTVQTSASNSGWNSRPVNASYTCLSQGYSEDAGARAIAPLIVLFSALALGIIAINAARQGVFE